MIEIILKLCITAHSLLALMQLFLIGKDARSFPGKIITILGGMGCIIMGIYVWFAI